MPVINILSNYHTHTRFSDGSHDPEVYTEEAINQGFSSIGFSDHSPLPFENRFAIQSDESLLDYSRKIKDLKNQYSGKINVFLGIEADYIPGITAPFQTWREKAGLEYLIGGVHLLKKEDDDRLWFIDGPRVETYDEGLKEIFGGNVVNAVTTYYRQVMQMIEQEKPDVVAHLDKITMHNRNRYFTGEEKWYRNLVSDTLALIRQNHTVVEVNTRGLYKKRSLSLFPDVQILKQINEMNIPVILSSDAHQPAEISLYFDETVTMLKDLGFSSVFTFNSAGWQPVEI